MLVIGNMTAKRRVRGLATGLTASVLAWNPANPLAPPTFTGISSAATTASKSQTHVPHTQRLVVLLGKNRKQFAVALNGKGNIIAGELRNGRFVTGDLYAFGITRRLLGTHLLKSTVPIQSLKGKVFTVAKKQATATAHRPRYELGIITATIEKRTDLTGDLQLYDAVDQIEIERYTFHDKLFTETFTRRVKFVNEPLGAREPQPGHDGVTSSAVLS